MPTLTSRIGLACLVSSLVSLLVGCTSTTANPGSTPCGAGGTCPNGFTCQTSSNICVQNGSTPDAATPIDAPTAPIDAPIDAPPGQPDAAPTPDAPRTPDASAAHDAPAAPDSRVIDSATIDTSPAPDTRPVDASPPDASLPDASLPDAPAAGGCSILGTWKGGTAVNYVVFTLNDDGSDLWQVHNSVGLNTGTGTYTYANGEITFDNLTVTMMQDPNFFACLNVVGTYSLAFAPDCNSFTVNRISDTCPVRPASGTLTRQ